MLQSIPWARPLRLSPASSTLVETIDTNPRHLPRRKHGQSICVDTDCECPVQNYGALPDDTNCGVAACIDYCKAKGEVAYACL
ncbi:hypothetical protein Bca52824_071053 [Brassica carinata]|uniref:Uncharacterized protein n=1 Tax=Brassica carinata TaxID=52824 RepID=A0A8X7Q522_BRACI|nr:hypothetical protein Bca52824_071053 [Brassica carinata]